MTPPTPNELLRAVVAMREAQVKRSTTSSKLAIEQARALEARVDQMITALKVKKSEPTESKLF